MKKHILIIAGLYVVAVALTVEFHQNCSSLRELQKRRAELQRAIRDLQSQTDTLRKEIEALENDPYYIERTAREQLNKISAGEITDEGKATVATSPKGSGVRGSSLSSGKVGSKQRMVPARWTSSRRETPSQRDQ